MWKSTSGTDRGVSGQRLTMPIELEDGRIPDIFAHLSQIFCALIVAALLWGSFAQIRELAVTQGEIVPIGSVQKLQHLEGGQVEKVLVKEGAIVEAGAPLLQLQPIAAQSDFGQIEVRNAGLSLQHEALSAVLDGREPDFGTHGDRFPALRSQQNQVYLAKRAYLSSQRNAAAARVAQREAEVDASQKERESLRRQMAIQDEQMQIRAKLLETGYTSRRAYLQAEAALEQIKSSFYAVTGRLETAKKQLEEAQSNLISSNSDARKTLLDERAKIAVEMAELKQQLAKQQDRVERLIIRSPVRGVVQELAQRAPGEVVKPGELVASIVPLGRKVVAEVHLRPDDVGHVHAGDDAEIKVSTFDPNIFGIIKGKVDHISATTFQTEQGEAYYKAVVTLEKNHVGSGDTKRVVLPGMEVQVDIITGSKSFMKYMLKPVFRSLNASFSER